jgi:hypothetical protein
LGLHATGGQGIHLFKGREAGWTLRTALASVFGSESVFGLGWYERLMRPDIKMLNKQTSGKQRQAGLVCFTEFKENFNG